MTHKPTQRRSSSGQYSWLWMLATVVVVGAFMYWLAATSEPSAPQVVEEDVDAEATAVATTVALDDLAAGYSEYLGTRVRLERVTVASRLGTQAFWTATSSGMPFLIRLSPELVAAGMSVSGGEAVTAVGQVVLMSDSVLAAWEIEGVISGDGQRIEAEFAQAFLEATFAEIEAPAGSQGE